MIQTNQESKIKILFVEDMETDLELAKREIARGGIQFTYRLVDTEEDFLFQLDDFQPDIVVSDYSMPQFDGMTALRITRSRSVYLPFVVLTGSMNEETAVACMKEGANDYVIKEQIKRLPFAVLDAIAKGKARIEKDIMEKQLRESEEKYRSLIDNSGDAIYLLSNDRFEIVNPEFEKLFGYSLQEVNQSNFEFIQLVAPESQSAVKERFLRFSRGEPVSNRFEFTAISKEGKRIEVETTVSYISFHGGFATQGIMRDITDKKNLIEELVRAKEHAEESDRLKSAFLANMSHEIRTPMNGILGFADLLQETQVSPEDQERYIGLIRSSGERMLNTINDLVDFSKIESGQVQVVLSEFNLNHQLNELCDFFGPEIQRKGLAFSCRIGADDQNSLIRTDRYKTFAILSNLIKNAIKFTDHGRIDIGYERKDNVFTCFVKDTGIGIAPEHQKKIFDRFVQADLTMTKPYEGAGLGLSITKSYIEMLEGEIFLESESGKGTAFYITIPDLRNK